MGMSRILIKFLNEAGTTHVSQQGERSFEVIHGSMCYSISILTCGFLSAILDECNHVSLPGTREIQ